MLLYSWESISLSCCPVFFISEMMYIYNVYSCFFDVSFHCCEVEL